MIRDLGIVRPGTTLYIPFHTFDSNDPSASVTLTGLATTDIEIYKDGSITQRASDSGYALLDTDGIDFDLTTGIHGISIDLADNTTAGFYAAGSQYWVVIASVTIDAATVNFVLCTFRIGYPDALFNTTIATLSTQTSFTLTTGPAEDDALNGCVVCIHDVASAVQCGFAVVSDYTGATKTVTLVAGTTFTAAASDNIAIFPPTSVHMWLGTQAAAPTVAGVPEVDVTHFNGTAGTFASGRPEVNTSHIAGSAVSTASAQIGVNVVNAGGTAWASGSLTSGVFATGAITAGAIAADAIGASELAADAVAEIADAVWDEDATAHQTQGTFGQAIGDPVADTNTIYKAVVTDATGATVGVDVAAVLDDTGTAGVVVAAGSKTGYSLTATTGLGNQTADITGNLSGSVGSVTGAVGSVTGNVGGNVAGSVGSVTGAVGSVTGNVGGNVAGSIGSLGATAKSDVNAEVLDVLNTDTFAEPGQEAPGATVSLVKKIGYLYKFLRNKITQTSTTLSVYDDAGTTVDQKATVSDDGTTYTRGEIGTGP